MIALALLAALAVTPSLPPADPALGGHGPLASAAGPFEEEARAFASPAPRAQGEKRLLQALGGTGAGVITGGAVLVGGLIFAFCECDDSNVGVGLVLAAPLTHAVTQAAVAHRIGRAYDQPSAGTFGGTLLGSALGTAAGTAVLFASDGSTGGFLAALAISTAGTLAGYELSRPEARRRASGGSGAQGALLDVGRTGVTPSLPIPRPYAVRTPDGRLSPGVTMPVLSIGF